VLELDAEAIFKTLAKRVRDASAGSAVHLVGIHTGGVWVAEKLRDALGLETPVGVLDVSFYRDDFACSGLKPDVRPSRVDFEVTGAHIVLVDDVLYTGRTVRAALNELFDHGRPARIDLAVLIDRGGRELPIAATFIGRTLEVPDDVSVELTRDAAGALHLKLEQRVRQDDAGAAKGEHSG